MPDKLLDPTQTPEAATLRRSGRRLILPAVLLGLLVLVCAVPPVPVLLADGFAPVAELWHGLVSLLPQRLQPLAGKAAQIYLSPWLYLLMAAVFLAERWLPADERQRFLSVGFIQDFAGWFVVGGLLRVVLVGVLVSAIYAGCNALLGGVRINAQAVMPWAMVVLLAVLVADLLNWFHHYIRHKVELFWLFHTIHHSQRQMNMFTDLRVHLVEYVIAKPISIVPLFLLGLDIELAFWLVLVLESYTRIYHGNLRTNYGPLRYLLVTPQSHRVHHSILPEHADKNFAVIFSFWDRLFGTQWTGYNDYPPTGVDDGEFPHESSVGGVRILSNYLLQLAYPFRMIWQGRRCGDQGRSDHHTGDTHP